MAKNDRGLARTGMSAEEWDYRQYKKAIEEFDPEDPRKNPGGHVYHNGLNDNSGDSKQLQDRINKTINKVLDMDIPESDKKDIIRQLTV